MEEDQDEKPWATGSNFRRRSLAGLKALTTHTLDRTADDTLPTDSPGAKRTLDRAYYPGQPKSLEGIALRAFCLGASVAFSAVSTVLILRLTTSPLWRLPFFAGTLSVFHYLEFLITARYNMPQATVAAFLLTANWPGYAIAHTAASLECLFTRLLFPGWTWAPPYTGHAVLLLGLVLVAAGQLIRSTAMIQAGESFNHVVQHRRRDGHTLVTTGIYATLRHPSYFGFFWWGIGTQLVLGNAVCLVAYTVVLWRFFSSRIRGEEASLAHFFGDEFVDYKKKVPTMIPFIS